MSASAGTSTPGTTGARRREAEASFLAATEELLAAGENFGSIPIERIASVAGRSRTAFYLYFRDKRDLLERLTESVAAQLYDIAGRWWSGEDGRGDLRNALVDTLAAYRQHPDVLAAVVEAATYDAEIGELWRGLVARFIDATEARLIAEGMDATSAQGTAFVLVWMTERSCFQQVVRESALTDEQLIAALHRTWVSAVYP